MKKMDYCNFFLLYMKMSEKNYCQRNKKKILNRAKDYYKNNRERLKKQERKKYRELPVEEKNIKREYGKNRYKNMSEEKKQRLKQYQKINVTKKNKEKLLIK